MEATYSANRDFVTARLASQRVARDDIEDLRQEVFLVALKKQPRLYDAHAAKAWLGTVCDFVALADRRRAYRRYEVPADLSQTGGASGSAAADSESHTSDWGTDHVHRGLSLMSVSEQELIALRLVSDMPFRTLAELHDCDVKTVRKRFEAAARRLQQHLLSGRAGTAQGELPSQERLSGEPFEQLAVRGAGGTDFALGALDRTLIVSWGGRFNEDALRSFLSFGQALVEPRGARLRCLSVVEPTWPTPRFEDRARIAAALRFLERYCEAFSLVGADHNYRLAEQILRGLGFLQGARYPFGTFNDLQAGARWLVSRERPSPEAAPAQASRLIQAVGETQERAAAQRPHRRGFRSRAWSCTA